MLISGKQYRSIWVDQKSKKIKLIDQRKLPHSVEIITLNSLRETVKAISDMYVRGAPLIGVTAAFGFSLAMKKDTSERSINSAYEQLINARPTAVNLAWACRRVSQKLKKIGDSDRKDYSLKLANEMANEDVQTNRKIGQNGFDLIKKIADNKTDPSPVRILTHCNAGWLATVDRGTATAPIYEASEFGIDLFVWVDETRPRNQGASLTAWELYHNKINNKLIVDNAGGHLMQKGLVDAVIVGSDRTTLNGDVCNKIGTYLKALAAWDNNIPFYAALPTTTIDFDLENGSEIPIEERDEEEVLTITGKTDLGNPEKVKVTLDGVNASNPGFDVTPSKYVTGLITDEGVIGANRNSILKLKK
ncbi:S-methyl-5-thioribose-1-phosphate isomerase [Paracoccaceae bacterium]|nr:S-methyl-5-thioribose-1-phosphate isomerase [Paracoccaceae bacterium]